MTISEAKSILHCPDAYGGIHGEKYGQAMAVAFKSLEAWEEIQRTIRMIQNCDKVIDMGGAVLDIVWKYLREVQE